MKDQFVLAVFVFSSINAFGCIAPEDQEGQDVDLGDISDIEAQNSTINGDLVVTTHNDAGWKYFLIEAGSVRSCTDVVIRHSYHDPYGVPWLPYWYPIIETSFSAHEQLGGVFYINMTAYDLFKVHKFDAYCMTWDDKRYHLGTDYV